MTIGGDVRWTETSAAIAPRLDRSTPRHLDSRSRRASESAAIPFSSRTAKAFTSYSCTQFVHLSGARRGRRREVDGWTSRASTSALAIVNQRHAHRVDILFNTLECAEARRAHLDPVHLHPRLRSHVLHTGPSAGPCARTRASYPNARWWWSVEACIVARNNGRSSRVQQCTAGARASAPPTEQTSPPCTVILLSDKCKV